MYNKNRGFSYHVSLKDIKKYQKVSIEKRLVWLYQANILRMTYPKRIIELQDKFRNGEI